MYKLIFESDYYKDDLLEVIARNRNVNLNKIKNPSAGDIIHYSKLHKMQNAIKATMHYRKRGARVGIVIDSDT